MDNILYILIVGAIAGFLAGLIMKKGHGIIINIILGIVGSFVGKWLFGIFGISIGSGIVSDIVTSAIGAIVLIFVAGLFKR